jgi:hypothetical protein
MVMIVRVVDLLTATAKACAWIWNPIRGEIGDVTDLQGGAAKGAR